MKRAPCYIGYIATCMRLETRGRKEIGRCCLGCPRNPGKRRTSVCKGPLSGPVRRNRAASTLGPENQPRVCHTAHHSSCESIMSAPSSEVREAPKASFASIQPPLSPAILEFLSKPPYNFPSPTPVQDTTIPLFLTHHDVFVRAVTGSGKTRKTTF